MVSHSAGLMVSFHLLTVLDPLESDPTPSLTKAATDSRSSIADSLQWLARWMLADESHFAHSRPSDRPTVRLTGSLPSTNGLLTPSRVAIIRSRILWSETAQTAEDAKS